MAPPKRVGVGGSPAREPRGMGPGAACRNSSVLGAGVGGDGFRPLKREGIGGYPQYLSREARWPNLGGTAKQPFVPGRRVLVSVVRLAEARV